MIDLHTHSTCSDGTDPPARVVQLAAAAGCSAVALTDHDTLAGLEEAGRGAVGTGIRLVPGCEVSCAFRGRSAHVLVYFVAGDGGPLGDELARLRLDRVERNRLLVDRLVGLGAPVTYDEIVAEAAGEESVGRPHVAAVLVRHGLADSVPDAFDRWLAEGRPAHVPKARVPPAEIAALARASGGVAVLAHPYTLDLAPEGLAGAVAELAGAGFAGIESYYARYAPDERAALAGLAQRNGLVATGGSDYHGLVKAGLSVGTGEGDLEVPDHVLEELEARRP
ncbi:MAG: PHP domain-containing protein [Acidimicrobiales bacterium]